MEYEPLSGYDLQIGQRTRDIIYGAFLFLFYFSFLYLGGVFNQTIIPLALVGPEMIIVN